jgi:energy-coupling factor transporter ATP-binding protein EcfA2
LYCGLNIESNIVIPEFPRSDPDKSGLFFYLESPNKESAKQIWLHHWLSPDGERLLSYGKQGPDHWLQFPELADFCISANIKEISCYPLLEVPQESIRHLLLDQVLPRCLAYQGKVMLHASAVRLEEGVILFIGDSGAGKSTLAGNFHQAGIPIISDDCVWVKESQTGIVAVPSYGGLRLWDDSLAALFAGEKNIHPMAHYSAKKRVSLNGSDIHECRKGVQILAMIMLSPPDNTSVPDVILDWLPLREAFITLMKQSFQLNVMDRDRIKRHSSAIGSIVSSLPAYRLSMPRDYALLPLARQKILETVLTQTVPKVWH